MKTPTQPEHPATKPAHTPTPWKLRLDGSDNSAMSQDGLHTTFICPVASGPDISWNEGRRICEANSALIVRAVNSHAELVAALRLSERSIAQTHAEILSRAHAARMSENRHRNEAADGLEHTAQSLADQLTSIRAALTKAQA
jgi:hypothetical protein